MNPGLVPATQVSAAGNGVIGAAMKTDIPVIHMPNMKYPGNMSGIPYDTEPRQVAPRRVSKWWSIAGVILFLTVLLRPGSVRQAQFGRDFV